MYKRLKEAQSENAKIAGENNADCNFYSKGVIHHEFIWGKQTVSGKFYK
jgi:hypothetical protein